MDTTKRTLAKSISWQTLGIITMTALGYGQIGSVLAALSLAASASLMGFITFFIHEKIWSRIRWGQANRLVSFDAAPGQTG